LESIAMICFKDIDEARKILGLGEIATVLEIKERYHKLSLKNHPDKCTDKSKSECEELFKRINSAYRTLMSYCDSYRYSFTEEDVKEVTGEAFTEEHFKRFYDDFI